METDRGPTALVLRGEEDIRRLAGSMLLIALGLLHHLIQEFIKRGAHLIHQALDLIFRRATVHRIAQLLLRRAQITFCITQAAIFNAQRHLPKEISDVEAEIKSLLGNALPVTDRMNGRLQAKRKALTCPTNADRASD